MLPLLRSQTECIYGAVIFRANCCNSGILIYHLFLLHLKTSSHICAEELDFASRYKTADNERIDGF